MVLFHKSSLTSGPSMRNQGLGMCFASAFFFFFNFFFSCFRQILNTDNLEEMSRHLLSPSFVITKTLSLVYLGTRKMRDFNLTLWIL